MSKFPILESHPHIYLHCADVDCLSLKGIIHIRIHPDGSILPWDIFYTHTQNLEVYHGRRALYSQLHELGAFIRKHRDPENPAIVMGDLNVYYTDLPWDYDELVEAIGTTIDLWKVKHGDLPGDTFATNNSFYAKEKDRPHFSGRLDYIFLFSSHSFIPILDDISVLNWTRNDRNISDHFGLLASFNKALKMEKFA